MMKAIVLLLSWIVLIQAQGTPVIIWHGMGDSCCNPFSMGRIKRIIEENTLPGTYVWPIRIGNNTIDDIVNSFLKDVNEQVEEVCDTIASSPEFANGYHAMGFSQVDDYLENSKDRKLIKVSLQGGQFLRAVAQRCPNPPMRNLVTLAAQHQGVFGFPGCPGESVELCNYMRELLSYGAYNDYVQAHLVQAQYWHDPLQFDLYVNHSVFIADINNERLDRPEYKENLAKLENFVMIKNVDVSRNDLEKNDLELLNPDLIAGCHC